MTQRRRGLTPPFALSEGEHRRIEATKGAEQEEERCISRGGIDGGRDVGDVDACGGAGCGVDLVVTCPFNPPKKEESANALHTPEKPRPAAPWGNWGI